MAMCMDVAAQGLSAHVVRDELHVSAPRIHFLIGQALERLHDGASVRFQLQLTVRADGSGRVVARSQESFAVSYDLWEEKFAVTKLGSSPRSVSHLSATAAEAWCIDNTSLAIAALGGTKMFWITFEYRADAAPPADQQDDSRFTLSGLIDIFSRRTRNEQVRGSEEIGPLSIDKLRRR